MARPARQADHDYRADGTAGRSGGLQPEDVGQTQPADAADAQPADAQKITAIKEACRVSLRTAVSEHHRRSSLCIDHETYAKTVYHGVGTGDILGSRPARQPDRTSRLASRWSHP